MSRKKKSRKPGSANPAEVIVTRNRSESDVEGRLRKRLNKRKGLKSGSRHSDGSTAQSGRAQGQAKDPRHGSKRPIPLIVEAKVKPNKQQRRENAEKELEAIQNDPQLNVLIDRIENGDKLGAGLQSYVDQKLDRLEALMKQLGIYEEDEVEQEEVAPVVEKKAKKKPASDDDLLSQFEDLDLNDFK
ncbi:MAG: Der GTPase-activating protein YihI [Vibrio sp.]